MAKKIVIAKLQIISGNEKAYLSLVAPLIEASKTEAGNLVYKLYQDTQNSSDFLVYEEYVNEEAFDAHCNTDSFQSFVQNVKPLLAKEMEIQVF